MYVCMYACMRSFIYTAISIVSYMIMLVAPGYMSSFTKQFFDCTCLRWKMSMSMRQKLFKATASQFQHVWLDSALSNLCSLPRPHPGTDPPGSWVL